MWLVRKCMSNTPTYTQNNLTHMLLNMKSWFQVAESQQLNDTFRDMWMHVNDLWVFTGRGWCPLSYNAMLYVTFSALLLMWHSHRASHMVSVHFQILKHCHWFTVCIPQTPDRTLTNLNSLCETRAIRLNGWGHQREYAERLKEKMKLKRRGSQTASLWLQL